MAPHGEPVLLTSYSRTTPKTNNNNNNVVVGVGGGGKPPRLGNDAVNNNNNLQRTVSDISFELSKEVAAACTAAAADKLPPISEVEDAKCECCGMSEDCTPEYIDRVRAKFAGRWICGLCSEAVKEEEEKNGGKREEAVNSHINACSKFNKFARAYPVLYQAEAMREMLKKTRADPRGLRAAKTFSARDNKGKPNKAGIARSSSCIPAITRDMTELNINN